MASHVSLCAIISIVIRRRGADIGGSDGIDVWGDNYWVHDVEVTNRDECVTVKVSTPRGNSICTTVE